MIRQAIQLRYCKRFAHPLQYVAHAILYALNIFLNGVTEPVTESNNYCYKT